MSSDRDAHEMQLRPDGRVTCSCEPRKVFADDRAVRDHADWAADHWTVTMPSALSARLAIG